MTSVGTDTDEPVDVTKTFTEWAQANSRGLIIAAIAVAVVAAGYLFYRKSQQLQEAQAERALLTAKQSIQAGNPQLAQADLDKVYSKYGSTQAGVEAAMLIAQIDFDAGKYQDGITTLEKASGTGPAATIRSTILSLEGDGYSGMGKQADAAKKYEDAAAATNFEMEKAFQIGKAARAYQAAGDVAKARAAWTALANDPRFATMSSEAHVRLGELAAQPATK